MLKLVAFDLDGTIADTLPIYIAAFKEAMEPYAHHSLSREDIEKTFGVTEEGMIKYIIKDNWEQALNDLYDVYEKMLVMCPQPFTGVIELIKELKRNRVIVTLITGKGDECCYSTLRHLGIENYFDKIDTGSSEKNKKAESIIGLLESYNLQTNEMVYIGDAVSDVTECRKANVTCLSAAWASTADTEKLEGCNSGNVFYSVEQLRKNIFFIGVQ